MLYIPHSGPGSAEGGIGVSRQSSCRGLQVSEQLAPPSACGLSQGRAQLCRVPPGADTRSASRMAQAKLSSSAKAHTCGVSSVPAQGPGMAD